MSKGQSGGKNPNQNAAGRTWDLAKEKMYFADLILIKLGMWF